MNRAVALSYWCDAEIASVPEILSTLFRRLTNLFLAFCFLFLSAQGGVMPGPSEAVAPTEAVHHPIEHQHHSHADQRTDSQASQPDTDQQPQGTCPLGHCSTMSGCISALILPGSPRISPQEQVHTTRLTATTTLPDSWGLPPTPPPPRI